MVSSPKKKPTPIQAKFLAKLKRKGPSMISTMRRDVIDRMVAAGWITLRPGPPRAHDRSRETHWMVAVLTEAGASTLPDSNLE